MDSILVEQKAVSCRNDKSKWWEGRRALDSRVEVSCKEQRLPLQSNRCPAAPMKSMKNRSDHLMTENFLENFQKLLKDMESLLGCWRNVLLPLSSDPEIPRQAQQLCGALSAEGVTVSEEMLKVWRTALLHIRKTHTHTQATTSYSVSLRSGCAVCFSCDDPRRSGPAGLGVVCRLGRGV